MKESKDGFAFVADCFGKDLFKVGEEEEEDIVEEEIEEEEEEDVDAIPIQTLEIWCVCCKQVKKTAVE